MIMDACMDGMNGMLITKVWSRADIDLYVWAHELGRKEWRQARMNHYEHHPKQSN